MSDIIIWSDGASKGNPGPGGWGAIVASFEHVQELGGREAHTTNNRMELTAAIEALASIPANTRTQEQIHEIILHTDSKYVIHGVTKWLADWKRRGWKNSQKAEVMNRDLWEKLDEIVENAPARIVWKHVGGHIGIPGNERVDEIASDFAENLSPTLFSGPRADYPIDISNVNANVQATAERSKQKSASSARSRAKAYSYVSMVDGIIKTHATWTECERRVKGVRATKFKKALDAADEREIIAAFRAGSSATK